MILENNSLKDLKAKYELVQTLKKLKNNNITKLEPSFDPLRGFLYNEIDHGQLIEQTKLLQLLEEIGIVDGKISKSIEKCKICDSYQFYINFACTFCKSSAIVQGATIKHDSCGNIDFEYKYIIDDNGLKCEKCNKSLRAIGVDYSKLGYFYECLECRSILPSISQQYLCINCGNYLNHDELSILYLKTYSVNSKKLSEVLDAKTYLFSVIEDLERMGIKSELSASIIGKSKMSHIFELITYNERNLPVLVVDSIQSDNKIDDILVLSFVAKSLDANVPNKILLTIPSIKESLKALANINGVIVIESETTEEATLDLIKTVTEIHNNSNSTGLFK